MYLHDLLSIVFTTKIPVIFSETIFTTNNNCIDLVIQGYLRKTKPPILYQKLRSQSFLP